MKVITLYYNLDPHSLCTGCKNNLTPAAPGRPNLKRNLHICWPYHRNKELVIYNLGTHNLFSSFCWQTLKLLKLATLNCYSLLVQTLWGKICLSFHSLCLPIFIFQIIGQCASLRSFRCKELMFLDYTIANCISISFKLGEIWTGVDCISRVSSWSILIGWWLTSRFVWRNFRFVVYLNL